jgi:hypothetical protein
MQELQVVVEQKSAIISANFEELKTQLHTALEEYKGLTYTEDTVAIARTDVANLRKLVKAIEEKRKEVKKAHMIPYEEFEDKAKELVKIINDTIEPIEKQIADYSEKKKEEKKAKIKEYFDSVIGDITFLSFDDVFNPKWISNVSTSMKSIKEEIYARIEHVKEDIKAIEDTGSDAVHNALSVYRSTKDLARAMQIINQYEKNKAEVLAREEARKREEEQRRALEEQRRKEEEERRRIAEEERRIAEAKRQAAEEERKRIEAELKRQQEVAPAQQTVQGFDTAAIDISEEFPQEDTEGFHTSGFDTEDFDTTGFDTSGFDREEPTDSSEEVITEKYMIKATEKQHEDIKQFLASNGIKYLTI